MWGMANILIGMKVSYSLLFWSYLQKGMTMNGIWNKGPKSNEMEKFYWVETIN